MPPNKKKDANLHAYRQHVRRCPTLVACPTCQFELLPRNFTNHCHNEHGLDSTVQCIWCNGRFTWKKNQKYSHADHLRACYDRFVSSNQVLSPPSNVAGTSSSSSSAAAAAAAVETPVLLNLEPLCRPRLFFGHRRLSDLPGQAYLPLYWTTPFVPLPLTFRDESLNAAAAYVRQFLDRNPHTSHWCHAMVKAVALESFLRALDEAGGEVTALPYSCWCDGGPHPQARFRQHRHFLLVAPTLGKKEFTNGFWKKVCVAREDRPPVGGFACKRLRTIQSALHLVNAMGYLSRRTSNCKFSFDQQQQQQGTTTSANHFYIFRTLPKHYKLPLVLGWDGGLLEVLHTETLKNVPLSVLAAAAAEGSLELTTDGSKYRRRLRHFFFPKNAAAALNRGLVLPVAKRFAPVAASTSDDAAFLLHLVDGRKLHFESDRRHEALGEEDWLRMQAERGNAFFDVVGDIAFWTPRKHHQITLHTLVPIVEENGSLKGRLAEATSRLETCEAKLKASEEERASQERKIANLEILASRLRIDAQSMEIENLKRSLEERDDIIAQLRGGGGGSKIKEEENSC